MIRYTRFPQAPGPVRGQVTGGDAAGLDRRPGPRPSDAPARPDPRPHLRRASFPAAAPAKIARERLNLAALLFMVSLIIPVYFYVGTLHLSLVRLVLLVAAVPLLVSWLAGGCGPIRAPDLVLMLFVTWMYLSFLVDGAVSSPEYAVISVIETLVPYLLARRFVRTEAQYAALVRAFFWIAVLLLPGAALESLTGMRIYNKLFSFLPTHGWVNYEPRWGMFRAQTVFEHPILFGVFAAFLLSPVLAWAKTVTSGLGVLARGLPVMGCTFFSLSAGAYMGLNIQLLLRLWGYVLRRVAWRWKLLAALVALAYVVVDLLSNRTPFQVFSTYFAFDAQTAYWRVLILRFGLENVWQHPILGLGLNDWVRPQFMHSASVDNFWLLQAMRHGIPGFLLMLTTYLLCLRQLIWSRPASPTAKQHREALAFSLIGLGLAIVTVHLWSATYNFFMFMLGATAWFGSVEQAGSERLAPAEAGPALSRAGASPAGAPARTA